jgi:Flp pilus assembly protein TadG
MKRRGESGQASVELVVLAPLLVVLAFAAAQLLAAGAAAELADHAAEAGAVALLQERDAAAAARDAVPGWSRKRMSVRVVGRRVHVRLTPISALPGFAGLFEARGEADAGPLEP